MNSELHNTWKTIVGNVAVENPELTYKIDKVANTSLHDLPTVKIDNIGNSKLQPIQHNEMIDISGFDSGEIDDMAATEPMTVGGEQSDAFGEETIASVDVKRPDTFFDETIATVADKTEEIHGNVSHEDIDETMDTVADVRVSNITISDMDSPQMVNEFTINDSSAENYLEGDTVVLPVDSHVNKIRCEDPTQNNSLSSLQVHQEIARGGMGVILKGKQNSLRREIAIKRLHDQDDETNKKKFVMEARVTAFLDHPNIIPIHELGMDTEGNPLLTMKLVRGKSWRQLLKDEKQQIGTPDHIQKHLEILLRVSDALAYAHSKKIIHNDLKPANIMVGEFGEVFLMDWGIAVSLDKSENAPTLHKTAIDTPMGTPNYMSPELSNGEGKKIGPWTDVYLLGGILYYVLMGKAPHHSNTIWESIRLSSEGHIPEIDDRIPEELRNICYKTLQKDPEDRYRSMEELQDAIHKFLNHWESINITKEAQEFLDIAHDVLKELTNGKNNLEEVRKKIPNPYCPISRALFGFNEALRIWPENPEAVEGKRQGSILYCEVGICQKDFNLAERVLGDIDDEQEKRRLKEKLDKMAVQDHCQKVKRDPRAMVAAVVIAVVAFTLGKLL
ncbi:serine/threonine-protein kinase [Candidatus Uabimicrobium amorphum]|uniref:Protein kinase n=1 Tax=Uabimicrobium amorphum TaxID=2596890 RepID=A0A5S9ISK1_UABAM|nr:serine/threonine-protein kinase [Candidatus Uabimicrobium amorphum]BBM86770.1 protein kinase [Candidatus Uabimicrobium amorphum]